MPQAGGSKDSKAGSAGPSAKPFSLSIGKGASTAAPRKRPHSTLDDGSDSDDDRNAGPQLLSGFDRSTGRAITENEPPAKKPLVIAEQKNRDWRAEAGRKKGKNLLPEEEQARRAGRDVKQASTAEEAEEKKPTYGLLVAQRSRQDEDTDTLMEDRTSARESREAAPKTADEEALEALLGNGTKGSSRVIANAESPDEGAGSRGDDFKTDVDARPEVPSLSDYAAVPIEEFGRALMRGMGWKDGEELGKNSGGASKPHEVKRRPALLGIGAKEVPEGLEEIGAWGKGAKKSRRIDRSYMPLVMENNKTGEKLTEDELAKRRQNDTLVQDDRSEQKAIMDSASGSRRDRDRHEEKRRDRDERNGHSSSRRDEREYRESDRDRSDRDRSDRDRDRDRKDRRDHHGSDRRGDREKSSRHYDDDDRKRRKEHDRDRRDREKARDRSREHGRRR